MERVIEVLNEILAMRDPFTAGHEQRVADLATAIGAELGLDQARLHGLGVAAIIHDLGKAAVSGEILFKPRALTAQERDLVRSHPEVGHHLLSRLDLPWPAAEVALQHHERLDGSGYPAGLRGDAILLEARIVAVADVVEAMVAHRPWRPPLGLDRARDEISGGRGLRYDPDAVDACLALIGHPSFILGAPHPTGATR
ncbi:MAG: HD-GYP domain-containing protein [Pseudomonadota bacterium]